MGTTPALLGAYVLAGELGRHDRAAFAAYATVMRPHVRKAQKLPPGTPRIANPRSNTGVRLLSTAARLAASPIGSRSAGLLASFNARTPELPDYAPINTSTGADQARGTWGDARMRTPAARAATHSFNLIEIPSAWIRIVGQR